MHWYSTFNPETYIIKTNTKKGFFRKETFFFPCVCAYKNATLLKYIIKKKKNLTQQNFVYFEAPKQYNPLLKGDVPSFAERALRFSG